MFEGEPKLLCRAGLRAGKCTLVLPISGGTYTDLCREWENAPKIPRGGKIHQKFPENGKTLLKFPEKGKTLLKFPGNGKMLLIFPRMKKYT